jgi:hypothetical protein
MTGKRHRRRRADFSAPTSRVDAYDPDAGQWTQVASMGTPRDGFAATELLAKTPVNQRIICEIGGDRFAIEFTITELNLEPAQVIPIRKSGQKDEKLRSVKRIPGNPQV